MTVSGRDIAAAVAAVLFGSGAAYACCTPPGHVVGVPGVQVGTPSIGAPAPGGSGPGCCGPVTHKVGVPGVSIGAPDFSVTVPTVTVNPGGVIFQGVQTGFATVQGVVEQPEFISSSGAYFAPSGVSASVIEGLNFGTELVTETVTEQVPKTENFCVDQVRETVATRTVQAVCLDDKGVPHPASRLDPSSAVDAGFSGELFRCMAGTSMQVTIGDASSGANMSFADARTFSCAKGEALAHFPGGDLRCVAQTGERDCNERSLLRRYGPGVKTLTLRTTEKICVPQTRTTMETVTRQVQVEKQVIGGQLILDGGVGQGVY